MSRSPELKTSWDEYACIIGVGIILVTVILGFSNCVRGVSENDVAELVDPDPGEATNLVHETKNK